MPCDITGSALQLTYAALPSDDPTQRRADITSARSRLGWEPTINLAAGLSMTIGYVKELLRRQ